MFEVAPNFQRICKGINETHKHDTCNSQNAIHSQYYTPIMVTLLHHAVMEHFVNKSSNSWTPMTMTMTTTATTTSTTPIMTTTIQQYNIHKHIEDNNNNNMDSGEHEHNTTSDKNKEQRQPHGLCALLGAADVTHRKGGITMVKINSEQ